MVPFQRLAAALLLLGSCGKTYRDAPPLSPSESRKTFRLSEDFEIELFLAEPQVVDPVEMVFDENGRIYVAEMRDYPDDPPTGKPARSRIRLLEDADGDGTIERAVVFADQLLQVSGLLPWKGGLIVTSAPDVLFLKDNDQDGRADQRRVLYTGFPKVNSEARITNLRLGIDNWIYGANSGSDGRITSPEHPERPPVLVRGTDFRFHPGRGLAEPASGPTQFGMTFDDWGNRFLTQNTTHLRHAVVPMQYLARNTLLPVGAVAQDISDHGRPNVPVFPLTRPQWWRRERTKLRQERYRENKLNKTEQVGGFFTAASGGTVYTGDAFPEEYRGNIFTGDVSANLVHRDILTPEGVTFSARRAQDKVEFLASTDVWFRPANFANAPDGNLYLLDMYREYIETPESIPEALKKEMDFYSGDAMGRIYRLRPRQPRRRGNLRPNLGAATTADLVKLLSSPNGWTRQTAQRLLVHGQDPPAVPLLRELAAAGELPQARLHALWTLEGLSALEPSLVIRALGDPHPGIREHALRLAEPFLSRSSAVQEAVLSKNRDPEPRVQFQLALTLGQLREPRALAVLAGLASARGEDPWFRTAVLSSVPDSAFQLFELLSSRGGPAGGQRFLAELASLIGAKHRADEVSRFLSVVISRPQPEWQAAALSGLARGLKLSGAGGLKIPAAEAALMKLLESSVEKTQEGARAVARHFELRGWIERVLREAQTAELAPGRRARAVRSLEGAPFVSAGPALSKLLDPREPPEVQAAAVETLGAFDDAGVGALLLARWKSYSPELRQKALSALLDHSRRVPELLEAIEQQRVEAASIESGARDRLIEHPDLAIRRRAQRLFRGSRGERAKVVESYRAVAALSGDALRGKQVFEKNCAKCHVPRRLGGVRVGPDLSGINNKTREALLAAILDPSAEIEPRFVNYVVVTRSGRMHDGILVGETPGTLTLRGDSAEAELTLLRSNIAEIRASSVSLMPEELEKQMSRQELADVIAYLRGGW